MANLIHIILVFYQRGQRHGYFRRFRWDKKFMDLSCFIKGQAVCNFAFRRVEGRAYVSLSPGQRIYLYPGLEFGYINGLFGSVSTSAAFSYRHGFPLIDICTESYSKAFFAQFSCFLCIISYFWHFRLEFWVFLLVVEFPGHSNLKTTYLN